MPRKRVVDLFAGWGGASIGAEMAGARVVLAANHWPLAVEAHAANHPGARHVCQDLRQMDWSTLPEYEILLAGPACQGHSRAGQPGRSATGRVRRGHDALRATAWAVVDCVDATEPSAVVVENVPEFAKWRLYQRWRQALEDMGYRVQELLANAADYGVPQLRTRLFVVAVKDHSRPLIELPRETQRPAFGPHIEWGAGRWKRIDRMPARFGAARSRLERARARHGDRCIVHHGWSGHRGLSLDEPLRTITTADQWVVVDGDRYRSLTIRENARGMGFPDSYSWPDTATRKDAIRGLGNAWCPPVGADLVGQLAG